MSRRQALIALCAWTYFLWTFRIGTIWQDIDASVGTRVGRCAPVVVFTGLATLSVVQAWRGRTSHPWISVFVAWTIGYWLVRVPLVAIAGHGFGFVAVHVVLALVSVGLALAVARRSAPVVELR